MTSPNIQTRAQRDLAHALDLVQKVKDDAGVSEKARRIYGGLCHQFPVMVRTVGLAQTLMFHAAKAAERKDQPTGNPSAQSAGKSGQKHSTNKKAAPVTDDNQAQEVNDKKAEKDRIMAHKLLLEHVAAILHYTDTDVATKVRDMDARQYLHNTRRILETWVYFKRFAVSILDVKSAHDAESHTDDTGEIGRPVGNGSGEAHAS